MITGKVTSDREAVLELVVSGKTPRPQQIQTVIDTGFNGYLTLPGNLIATLQLRFAGHRRATLGDGSTVILNAYLAAVVWHGGSQEVLVSEADGVPLVGMSLLRGSRVTMDIVDDGDVVIDKLP